MSQGLKALNLADNLLEELLPRLFQQLTKLKYLDLSGNPLEDLTPDVFRDIMVRTSRILYSSDVQPIEMPHSNLYLLSHQDLRALKCRRCGVEKVNPQLYRFLGQLADLDLGDNQVIYSEAVSSTLSSRRSSLILYQFHPRNPKTRKRLKLLTETNLILA